MPSICSVPGCRTNYTKSERTSVFLIPKDEKRRQQWITAIRRENCTPGSSASVCINHFEERFIERELRATRDDGTELVLPLNKLRLTKDAYPTILLPTTSQSRRRKNKESQHWIEKNENPLQELLKQIIQSDINLKIINSLDLDLYRQILKMFAIDYPIYIFKCRIKYSIQRINYKIDVSYLIELLEIWKGWKMNDSIKYLSSVEAYKDLYNHLHKNFDNYQLYKYQSLLDELNKYCSTENHISMSCSMKELKTMFYHHPYLYKKYYREHTLNADSSNPNLLCDNVVHLPFISTQIELSNFSMEHQNDHTDEYHIFNISNANKSNLIYQENCDTFHKLTNDENETYLTKYVVMFLNQLKLSVNNCNDRHISSERKCEIVLALTEFEKDIAHCGNTIEINTKYCINTVRYPYVRYLGIPDNGIMNVSITQQKSIEDVKLNVRLREIRYPKIYFNLKKFSASYVHHNEDIHFIFNEDFLNKLNNCISYKCVMCNEDLGSFASSLIISDHLFKYHGLEPDWECVKCFRSFSNDYLTRHRWWHNCSSFNISL